MIYAYDMLKSYAIESNLITIIDSQYYDMPNRTESPYATDPLFALAGLRTSVEGLIPIEHQNTR